VTAGVGVGAFATALPGGAVAVSFEAVAWGTVPGSTWKNRYTLLGAEIAVPAARAAFMAVTLVRVPKVVAVFVATTSTFHQTGLSVARVPTMWS
jgi:hypothetical protein